MNNQGTGWLVGALVMGVGASAHGQAVPDRVSFSARLTDGGVPVTGSHALTFALWNDSSGGAPVWTETHGTAAFSNGLVLLELGSLTTLDDTVFDGRDLWLEITLDGAALSPRLPIASVP